MINYEKETTAQVAESAARRAIEAISRVGTINTDVGALTERVASLEATIELLIDEIEKLLKRPS